MARTPKPWFRASRNSFFVMVRGKQHDLGPDKAEAFRRFHELMAMPAVPATPKPAPLRPNSLSVAEAYEAYLDWAEKHRSPRTYEWNRGHVQSFCDHLKTARTTPAADLRPFHLVTFVDSHATWGANQKRGVIVALSRPLNWCVKMGLLDKNPAAGIEKPQAKKRESCLTPADFTRLLGFVKDEPFRDLLTFAYEAGVRPQESRHIEARHVRLELHRIEIPPDESKGKRRWRVIYLSDNAATIVARLMAMRPTGKLFLNTDGNPWKAQALVCRLQRLLVKMTGAEKTIPSLPRFDRRRYKNPADLAAARERHLRLRTQRRKDRATEARKAKERYAMYDLRHLFATRKLKEGHDPITVANLLGHKDATMLCRHYEEISRDGEHLRQAANSRAGV